jgi:hypothetical protein
VNKISDRAGESAKSEESLLLAVRKLEQAENRTDMETTNTFLETEE